MSEGYWVVEHSKNDSDIGLYWSVQEQRWVPFVEATRFPDIDYDLYLPEDDDAGSVWAFVNTGPPYPLPEQPVLVYPGEHDDCPVDVPHTHPGQTSVQVDRYRVNDLLTRLAADVGVTLDDETLNELTHHVADVLEGK